MSDDKAPEDHEIEGIGKNFTELPYDVLLHIFNFVPSKVLWENVRLVCRLFSCILSNQSIWITRLHRPPNVQLPLNLMNDVNFSIPHTCINVEEDLAHWSNERFANPITITGHISNVDALMMMKSTAHKRLCISGSRDRCLVAWDIDSLAENGTKDYRCHRVGEAHEGWIWSACQSSESKFCTSGWDSNVNSWSIGDGGIDRLLTAKLSAAVLTVACDENMIICGTFDRRVVVMDERDRLRTIANLAYHRYAVLDLAHVRGGNYLYSCGQDRHIVCVDKRMWKALKQKVLQSYAHSVSLNHGQLLCGRTDGYLVLMDPNSLGIIHEHRVEEGGYPIRQVKSNRGSYMCLTKTQMKIYTPGLRPHLIAESNQFGKDPSRFAYSEGSLAVSADEGKIFFWLA